MRSREIDRKCVAYEMLRKHLPFLQQQISYHKARIDLYKVDLKSQGRLATHQRLRKQLSDLDQHIREELALCKRYKQRQHTDIGSKG